MDEIKTGAEIYNLGKYENQQSMKNGLKFATSKWVSVDWLKQKIEKRKQIIVEDELLSDLDWILKILEG